MKIIQKLFLYLTQRVSKIRKRRSDRKLSQDSATPDQPITTRRRKTSSILVAIEYISTKWRMYDEQYI